MHKAYIVQEPDEGSGMVIYAASDIAARKQGAIELTGDERIAGITCRRCPALDDKEDDPRAQTRHLLNLGWVFHLDGCHRVTEEDHPFVPRSGGVWRSWMEWLNWRVECAERRYLEKQAAQRLWGEWPWAEEIDVHVEPSGKIDAHIRLPYLSGSLRYLEREDRYYVERRDLMAFRCAYTVNCDGRVQA